MRLEIIASNKFRKDLKLARKRGLKLEKLDAVVETLQTSFLLIPDTVIMRLLETTEISGNVTLNRTGSLSTVRTRMYWNYFFFVLAPILICSKILHIDK